MFSFAISAWQAWAPGIEDSAAWETWAHTPYCPAITATPPDLGFLPPLQRRRLSPLARMAVACAWPLADDRPAMPVVYASHHGETTRSFKLLQCLARDEALSPTAFSLSVHNATVGMWSILRKETVETIALSASQDGLESAITEACLLLDAGHSDALVVLAEETPPIAYRRWIDDIPFSYALAMRVSRGREFELRIGAADESEGEARAERSKQAKRNEREEQDEQTERNEQGNNEGRQPANAAAPASSVLSSSWPHSLSLLQHMLLGTPEWRHPGRSSHWHWRRVS